MASERQLLEEKSPWWGEHLHRYEAALPWIGNGAKVLDLACGTGFGSHLLAQHTSGNVVGGDIAPDIIEQCRRQWQCPNLSFEVLDGTALPYSNGYFNALVSFETIEHTRDYRQMLAEFRRVLRHGGNAIISTPNFIINSPSGKVTNPFHTQEFVYDELYQLLREVFAQVRIFGQQYIRYTQKKGLKWAIAQATEALLYQRGVRKMPIEWQDQIMQTLIKKPQYPLADDYILTEQPSELMQCKTFFAICS